MIAPKMILKGSVYGLLTAGLSACAASSSGWDKPSNFAVPQTGGERLPPHVAVPQIAYAGSCPRTLTHYEAQLEYPSVPPAYLRTTVDEVITRHGDVSTARTGVAEEIVDLRSEIRRELDGRSISKISDRQRADDRISRLSDRLLVTQAMLAALECVAELEESGKPAPRSQGARRS